MKIVENRQKVDFEAKFLKTCSGTIKPEKQGFLRKSRKMMKNVENR